MATIPRLITFSLLPYKLAKGVKERPPDRLFAEFTTKQKAKYIIIPTQQGSQLIFYHRACVQILTNIDKDTCSRPGQNSIPKSLSHNVLSCSCSVSIIRLQRTFFYKTSHLQVTTQYSSAKCHQLLIHVKKVMELLRFCACRLGLRFGAWLALIFTLTSISEIMQMKPLGVKLSCLKTMGVDSLCLSLPSGDQPGGSFN